MISAATSIDAVVRRPIIAPAATMMSEPSKPIVHESAGCPAIVSFGMPKVAGIFESFVRIASTPVALAACASRSHATMAPTPIAPNSEASLLRGLFSR